MGGFENKLLERVDIPPNAHVDDQQRIREYPQGSRVTIFGVQPPDKSRRTVRKLIDFVKAGSKACHFRFIKLKASAGDIDLSELVVGHGVMFEMWRSVYFIRHLTSGHAEMNTRKEPQANRASSTIALGTAVVMQCSGAIAAGQIDVTRYAEPVEAVKTFRYESSAEGTTSWVMNGRVIESPAVPASEEIDGLTYRARIQKTEGIDGYAPADARIFFRTESDGLFTAFDSGNGRISRYLQVPSGVQVGNSWQGPSKFWDEERLTKIDAFSSDAVDHTDCLFIERLRKARGVPPQTMTALNVYCPDVGAVRTRTELSFEGFRSVTDQVLVDIRPR